MGVSAKFDASTNGTAVAATFKNSITDKVFLITGVSKGGIGGATAKALAAHSPRLLILAGRSSEKIQAVIEDISTNYPRVACRFLPLDLSSQASIRKAAAAVLAYSEPLHILINNAAVMAPPHRTLTPTGGIELQFQTNHLGPFLLTNLLLPKLLSTASSTPAHNTVRIINLSSSSHTISPIRFSDLNFSNPNASLPQEEQFLAPILSHLGLLAYDGHYVPMAAYAQSKTADILFTIALNARLAAAGGKGIRSFAVHPGSIDSELQRHSDQGLIEEARNRAGNSVVSKTLDQGASTTLVAALDPELQLQEGAVGYMSDCDFVEPAEFCRGVRGQQSAERLWTVSEELVGQQFRWRQ